MTATLDHTIVPVKDQDESVEFYTRVLGFQYDGKAGMNDHFAVIRLNDSFTLDLQRFDEIPDPGIHYAFALDRAHFDRSFVSAADLGHKTLAVNLSDLAAMGATPRFVVLSLVLPATMAATDLDMLVDGMLTLADRHQVALVGGNITRSGGPLVLGMTAIGALKRRRVLTRAGGRPGDELWVTGTLGGAAAA